MFSKFNCEVSVCFYNNNINNHCNTGRKIYEQFQKQSQACLEKFLLNNDHIDGTSLKNHWFNILDADVFISHSHQDIEKVKAFAGWLKEKFGLTSFIDSCVWGYCDELLKEIDDKYCKNKDGKTYNYYLRNYTTSHVHAMLSSALLEMIDKTECLIFYNTPHSIYLRDELNKIGDNKKTLSPWIYNELSVTNILQPRNPLRFKKMHESFEHFDKRFYDSAFPKIEYDVNANIKNMIKMDDTLLTKWLNSYNNKEFPLDTLYKLVSSNNRNFAF